MYYYAILNIGQNELGPVNIPEFLFVVFTLIISSIMMSIVFGDVVTVVSERDMIDTMK
jgi:hypothetical protein